MLPLTLRWHLIFKLAPLADRFTQIKKINSIFNLPTITALKTLVQSTEMVRLDHCNSLYHGLPMKSIKRLQLAHNSTARLITLTSRFEPISPILKQLHWLPIHKRCQFKILALFYKALHTSAPPCQYKLYNWYQPPRPLRSASTTSLVPSKNKTVRHGHRLLNSSAATLWNILLHELKCAKRITLFHEQIKHLFIIKLPDF